MSGGELDTLRRRLSALQGRYQLRFADKPRATRDLGELDMLIKEASALETDLEAMGGPDAAELGTQVAERLDVYRTERDAVAKARAAGDEYVEAALLGTRANFVIARYHRHFAGQDRRDRDLGLLSELAANLEGIQRRMARVLARRDIAELRRDLEVVTENLGIYRQESELVARAQAAGAPDERGSLLAALANRQFAIYQHHLAGRSRLSRRPGLVERMIGELERVLGEMEALSDAGFQDPAHARNRQIVTERLEFYRKELAAIRESQAGSTVLRRIEALGEEANELMRAYNDEYAGEDRASRDLERMGHLADRMLELEQCLTDAAERYDLEHDHGPSGLVRDALVLFEKEWRQIRDARLH